MASTIPGNSQLETSACTPSAPIANAEQPCTPRSRSRQQHPFLRAPSQLLLEGRACVSSEPHRHLPSLQQPAGGPRHRELVGSTLDCAPPTAEPQQRLRKTARRAQEGMADGGAWLREEQSARLCAPLPSTPLAAVAGDDAGASLRSPLNAVCLLNCWRFAGFSVIGGEMSALRMLAAKSGT